VLSILKIGLSRIGKKHSKESIKRMSEIKKEFYKNKKIELLGVSIN
jgi:hypothetical protein